jgi:hypothetical protein
LPPPASPKCDDGNLLFQSKVKIVAFGGGAR